MSSKSMLRADNTSPSPSSQEKQEQARRRRGKTLHMRRLSREERAETESILLDLGDFRKPKARSECQSRQGPCPFVSCKYHLYLDVNPQTGSIKINFPHLEVWEMPQTCALDIADRGGTTLEEVGEIINLTRERIRQVEAIGLEKLRAAGIRFNMQSYLDA